MKFLEYLKVEMKFNFQMLSWKEKTFLLGVKLNNLHDKGKGCSLHKCDECLLGNFSNITQKAQNRCFFLL